MYGTAGESKEQLEAYYHLKEEAARRDHRKLGQELDLFSIQESAGVERMRLLLRKNKEFGVWPTVMKSYVGVDAYMEEPGC